MSDDGSDRNLSQWADKEIFSSHGQMDVESESDGGRTLIASFSDDIWGTMRTQWLLRCCIAKGCQSCCRL